MKTKVLLVAAQRTDGTSYYRAVTPYSRIKELDLVEPDGKMLSWATLSTIDVCVFQRPASSFDVNCIEAAKRYNKPVIVDFDDNGFAVNSENPAYEFYSMDDKREAMRAILKLADVVTVSTQALKDALLKEAPTANIEVIVNAVDDTMFSLKPCTLERNKIILLRGASSHSQDWGAYKEAIIETMAENPDWQLAVMGMHLEWMRNIKNIRLYQFTSIPEYFETLMQLLPAIQIVPLEFNEFNLCKSNVAALEGTLAGAAVMASDLPEFDGFLKFWSRETFKDKINLLINNPDIRQFHYENALDRLPLLSRTNEQRRDIIERLVTSPRKYAPNKAVVKPATDLEFHQYALSRGHCQDNPNYVELHNKLINWIIKTINPKTVLELGSGPGGTVAGLLKSGVMAYGIELNPHSVQYFKDKYPMFENQVVVGDLTKEPIETDAVGDLVMSVECFEHVNQPEEKWIEFLTDLSQKFKFFYFTSTPYYDKEEFLEFWGHCNIRKMSDWIDLFEKSGWKMNQNPKVLVPWDLLFVSTSVEL
jgi:hypothetical protein